MRKGGRDGEIFLDEKKNCAIQIVCVIDGRSQNIIPTKVHVLQASWEGEGKIKKSVQREQRKPKIEVKSTPAVRVNPQAKNRANQLFRLQGKQRSGGWEIVMQKI